ncbi:rho-N domain-containing protein 1 [Hibiscus syriacus]|uniref:Rho-N domain-containing protein 1 n=1 Tax=Hibiscus syriacus TaxID=106335 RepID=A0A6A3AYV1_HIBSY|nr:rho-N domain-containing protein 1, chloroplastic-like [Hibiscus syriacus]KAE8708132.1 rho-N domain-containing protein 1 [Hibiscus syriacus]
MSHALHLLPNNVPGYGPTDCRYRSDSGISGRAMTLSPCSSHSHHIICTQVKIRSLKCSSRGIYVVCRAGSSGHRRNPDLSRQRHGFRGKNRQNEERENLENIDESEMISSKNGPLLSLSGSTKFQAAAAPGPREKEIVEPFRKVQAKLKERAAVKEDKKTEASQGKGKESETVDSLLKLLRKHSVEQGKKKNSDGNSRHLHLDDPEVNGSSNGDKSSSFFGSNDRARSETKESYVPSLSRPASNFRRKSPVPQMKYQTIYSGEETVNSVTHVNSDRNRNLSMESHPAANHVPEEEEELEFESEPEDELELEPESIYQESDALAELSEDESSDIDEEGGEQQIEHEDFSALKLPELRALAKSRGLKGFSKMKKGDLVSLLSSSV